MQVQRLSTAQHRGILITWRNRPRLPRVTWPALGAFLVRLLVVGGTLLAIHAVTGT